MAQTSMFHGDLVSSSRILYTPSAFARTSLIHLQEIGRLEAKQPHTSKRDHLMSFLFFIVLTGSGTLEYHETVHRLQAGDCVFLDCRSPYSHQTSENLWQLKWIHFYGPNMADIYDKYTERGGRTAFHPVSLHPYEQLLDDLYQTADSSDYIRDMRIYEKITGLLTLLMEESWHPENRNLSAKKQNLLLVKEYLDTHFHEKILLDQLAETFYINKYYLTRVFREQFGLSISNYLLQLRVTRAKQLLRFTDRTIESIGAECGMEDGNYFARMFRRVEGMSPSQFRRSWVNNPRQ